MGVWVGSAIAVLGIAGAWLVARSVSRRAHQQTRAEVMALRTELAGAMSRISSREEAAAIMARVDAAIAEEPERSRRAGLVLIKGGLAVAGAAGTAASAVAHRARQNPGIALVAAAAAAGTTAVALMWPFSGETPNALREPPAPGPTATAPATRPTRPQPGPTATSAQPAHHASGPSGSRPSQQPRPHVDLPRPAPAAPDDQPPATQPQQPQQPPGDDPGTPQQPPDQPPPGTPDPTPPPPNPTPTPTSPATHPCTVRLGHLVCVRLPLPL